MLRASYSYVLRSRLRFRRKFSILKWNDKPIVSHYEIQEFSRQLDRNLLKKKDVRKFVQRLMDKRTETHKMVLKIQEEKLLSNNIELKSSIRNFIVGVAGMIVFSFSFGYIIVKLKMRNSQQHSDMFSMFDKEDSFDEISPNSERDEESDEQNDSEQPSRSLPTFADVCGNDEAKEELQDIVQFLKNPPKFKRMNAKIPKGVLLSGLPGCGKTLMARALAGEAEVTFLSASGSSFDQMYVGVGAARIRKLFKRARERAPCIIFIDELDAVGEKRSSFSTNKMTLNQLLTEMDGFNQSEGVVVVAATNLPQKLDPALTRSGRFDRHVEVSLPDKVARKQIIDLNLKKKPVDKSVDTSELARDTLGLSGADIANFVNIAATEAVKHNESEITTQQLRNAIDIAQIGRVRKSLHVPKDVTNNTAIHEAGHTLVALFTPGAREVSQLTILPRGPSLGSTQLSPFEDEQFLQSKEQMLANIDVYMGGHAAEEMAFGNDKVSSGASSDFQGATSIAIRMVGSYGMSDNFGKMAFDMDSDRESISPELQKKIHNEVNSILDDSYERVRKLLKEKEKTHKAIVSAVLERNTLSKSELYDIVRLSETK